jgi:hypothetical protein
VDSKTKGKIIQAIRKVSMWSPVIKEAEQLAKRGPSLFECKLCGVLIYTGSRKLEDICSQYPDRSIIAGRINRDHEPPVIPIEGFKLGSWDWNEYIDNLMCTHTGPDGINILCEACHKDKTDFENKKRKEHRKKI